MSVDELPCLSTLSFQLVLEELFTRLISPELLCQAGVDFTTNSSKRAMSEEIIPVAILIIDGVGKGSLRMVTIFSCSDQVKVEPLVMLTTLVQWDSHQPALVVRKIFTNSPYFPWGSFGLPYMDVGTLPEGVSTIQFPLFQLHLHWLLLYSPTQVILPKEKEGNELMVTLIIKEALWDSSVEDHHMSSLVPLSAPAAPPCPNKDESSQTDKGLDLSTALRQLQVITQAKSQLRQELLCKQCEKNIREDKLIAREIGKI